MENILKVSADQGQTVDIPFEELAQDGQWRTDSFEQIADQHPEAANARVLLPEGSYEGTEAVVFAIDRAAKTLGTYVTRINKLVNGISPALREARSGSGGGSATKANIGIEQDSPTAVRLFEPEGDGFAEIDANGAVSTNNFEVFAYFVEGVLNPHKWQNRLDKLRQFSNGVEATPPELTLTYSGQTISLKNDDDQTVINGRIELLGKLIKAGTEVDANAIMVLEPEMTGGGTEWLADWVAENFPTDEEETEE